MSAIFRGTRTVVVGVLNATPDSFSDGGRFVRGVSQLDLARAVDLGAALLRDGADVLDVGGESTRPGAAAVPAAVECERAVPVIEALAKRFAAPLSIDTRKAAVAEAALAAGAAVVLGHMQGTPATMQAAPAYDDVVAEVAAFLRARAAAAEAAGVAADAILVDPGIGFGKRPEDNLALLARLAALVADGRPVVVGVSRKRFLGLLTGADVADRLAPSLAAAVLAAHAGARVLRVHDVAATRQALAVADAIARAAG